MGRVGRLLTPLDGSRLAESVLPAVEAIAGRCGASVILMHIREEHPPATIHNEPHLRDTDEAARYLDRVATALRNKGIEVACHVHETLEGDVARSIVQHADEFAPDLVLLCTHGHGGVRDWLYGSIAQQVLRLGTWPVLLMEPAEDGSAPPFNPRRILVPVDGSNLHESPHGIATSIARAFEATVMLLVVVPTRETLAGDATAFRRTLPATTTAMLQLAEAGAAEHIRMVQAECMACGVEVTAQVVRGDTVTQVLAQARESAADLIVLASHGRAGIAAAMEGSVGARIISRARIPLLLVRTLGS
jgi:nucleotide-binding universal stress UspA family protein